MPTRNDLSDLSVPSRQRILEEVIQIVAEFAHLEPNQIYETSDLNADLQFDSLDYVEITMEIEEHFGISAPDEFGERIRTVGTIVDGVVELLGQSL
jgi:acyl carrier protein